MTKLVNILKEMVQSSDGYWIDKHGKIYNVDDTSTSHYRYAEKNFEDVMTVLKERHNDYNFWISTATGQSVIDVALELGYIRLIIGKQDFRLDYYVQLNREVLTGRAKNSLLYLMTKNQNKIGQITFDDRKNTRTFFDIEEFEENLNMQLVLHEEFERNQFTRKELKIIDLFLTIKQPSLELEKIILKHEAPILACVYLAHIKKEPYNKESIKKISKRHLKNKNTLSEILKESQQIKVYHFTDKNDLKLDFSKFTENSLLSGFGIHFGTLEAAKQRAKFKEKEGNIKEFKLDVSNIAAINKPVKEEDFAYMLYRISKKLNHPNLPELDELKSAPLGIMSQYYKENPNLYKEAVNEGVKELKQKGFKGAAYYNKTEDPGSVSYVIFDESIISK